MTPAITARLPLPLVALLAPLTLALAVVLSAMPAAAQEPDEFAARPIRMLVVDGDPGENPSNAETFYFRQLVATVNEERNLTGDDPYALETAAADTLETRRFDGVRAVVLANVPGVSGRTWTALQWYVARGGMLILSLGDKCDLGRYNALFQSGNGSSMLPVHLDGVVSGNEMPVSVSNRGSDLGALVDAARPNVSKLVRVKPNGNGNAGGAVDGVRLQVDHNGSKLPLLVTAEYGRGVAVLFTSSLDTEWNALPASPAFMMWNELLTEYVLGDAGSLKLAQRPAGRLKLLQAQMEAVETEGAALLERARKLREAGKADEAQRLDLLVEALVSRHDSLQAEQRDVIAARDTRHWLPRDLRNRIVTLEEKLDTDSSIAGPQRVALIGELEDARKEAATRRRKLEMENAEWSVSIVRMEELAKQFLAVQRKLNRMPAGEAKNKLEAEQMRTGYELTSRYNSWKTGMERRVEEWNDLMSKARQAGDNDVAAKLRKESDQYDEWKMKVMVGQVMEAVTIAEVENSMRAMNRNTMAVKIQLLEEQLAAAREVNDPVAIAKLETELREAKLQLAKLPVGGR